MVQLLISQLYVNFLMIFERCSDFSNTFSRVPNAGALLLALYLSEYSAICFLFWEISDSKAFHVWAVSTSTHFLACVLFIVKAKSWPMCFVACISAELVISQLGIRAHISAIYYV